MILWLQNLFCTPKSLQLNSLHDFPYKNICRKKVQNMIFGPKIKITFWILFRPIFIGSAFSRPNSNSVTRGVFSNNVYGTEKWCKFLERAPLFLGDFWNFFFLICVILHHIWDILKFFVNVSNILVGNVCVQKSCKCYKPNIR